MKVLLCVLGWLIPLMAIALDAEVCIDNDQVCVVKWTLMPNEVVPSHRDEMEAIVIALQGGTITRQEADGSFTDVIFPTGVPVHRPIDPVGEFHTSINHSDQPIEAISILLKPR